MRTTSKKADIKYKLQNRKFRGNSKLVYNPFEFSPKNRRAKIIKESGNITETYQPSKSFHPVFEDLEHNVRLFQADCLEILDYVVKKEPLGYVDMIFADPPYFLSNGGITCHAGRMVSVNKGHWDKSRGPDAYGGYLCGERPGHPVFQQDGVRGSHAPCVYDHEPGCRSSPHETKGLRQ